MIDLFQIKTSDIFHQIRRKGRRYYFFFPAIVADTLPCAALLTLPSLHYELSLKFLSLNFCFIPNQKTRSPNCSRVEDIDLQPITAYGATDFWEIASYFLSHFCKQSSEKTQNYKKYTKKRRLCRRPFHSSLLLAAFLVSWICCYVIFWRARLLKGISAKRPKSWNLWRKGRTPKLLVRLYHAESTASCHLLSWEESIKSQNQYALCQLTVHPKAEKELDSRLRASIRGML